MQCPSCNGHCATVTYENIAVESCGACGGIWLDCDELARIVQLREVKFSEEERRAVAAAQGICGVQMDSVGQAMTCPKDGNPTAPFNYGGDTGIIIDRCTACGGMWLDAGELENIQLLVEGWQDMLPQDLAQHGARLRQVEMRMDRDDDVAVSRIPLVGRFINACMNGVLDMR